MKIIPKVWGWEVVLVSNELYSCKLMVIKKRYQCSIHHHKQKDETFILLTGSVMLLHKPNAHPMMELFTPYRIPRGMKHRFAGFSTFSLVLEVATEDISTDSYRETESGKVGE